MSALFTTFKRTIFPITLLSVVAAAHPAAATGPLKATLARIMKSEPEFADIFKAYVEEHELGGEHLRGWEKKIRKAALMPTLYVGFDQSNKSSESLSITDNISISGGSVTVGPEDNDLDLDNDQGQVFRVRAVWQLDEIVFNGNLFTLARERRELATLKITTGERVFKLWEARYQHLDKYLRSHSARDYISYKLLTDRINELTGRRFAARLWRKP